MRTQLKRIVTLSYASALDRPTGQRVGLAVLVLVLLTALGTAGYMLIEELTLVDALYMSVITLSTVGYGEVTPLSPAGRVFSIIFIVMGLGAALYTAGVIAEYLLEGRLSGVIWRRQMTRKLSQLKQHVIVCGYGRLGAVVVEELTRNGTDVVIIEPDPALEPALLETEQPYVLGSSLEDDVLTEAGIARARAIVITIPSDADCAFVTLSARQLNANILIHTRAENETSARRMRMAGADQITAPHRLGGERIANALLRPAVVDFIELSSPGSGPEVDMEEVIVGAGSALDGHDLAALHARRMELVVVALQHPGQPMRISPPRGERLRAGDHVVVVGQREALAKLAALVKAR
ncbi:MAG: potassium channel protein [Haliangiales bacterium]